MYTCIQCKSDFENPIRLIEKHNLQNPPYEHIYVCPICKSSDFKKNNVLYCRCCGAKLQNGKKDYCSDACKTKGEKLWQKEIKRKKLLIDSSLYAIVREVEAYNKKNHTKFSYGQYVAFIKTKPKGKRNEKQKEVS